MAPGVFVTTTPASVAADRSTESMPTPHRDTCFSPGHASKMLTVYGSLEAITASQSQSLINEASTLPWSGPASGDRITRQPADSNASLADWPLTQNALAVTSTVHANAPPPIKSKRPIHHRDTETQRVHRVGYYPCRSRCYLCASVSLW